MARHRPDCGHVEQRHADADQDRNHLQALRAGQAIGQRQRDEGVEAKRHLRTRRMVAPVDVRADPGQVGQRVSERNARDTHRQARSDQARRGTKVQRAFHDGVKQQDRKQEEIHQALHRLPYGTVQRRVPAQEIPAQNQGKIGEEQLRVVHGSRIPSIRLRCG
jgi:hypothetical protein